jgi:uncharacterized protein YceH (UPF0502 family)
MSEAYNKIAEGLNEAIAIARGERVSRGELEQRVTNLEQRVTDLEARVAELEKGNSK